MNTKQMNKAQAAGAQVAQHTPGPWHVPSRALTGLSENIVWNQAGQLIAACDSNLYIDAETKKANARLIAAAPELLEALKVVYNNNSGEWRANSPDAVLARTAIAKVEGKL